MYSVTGEISTLLLFLKSAELTRHFVGCKDVYMSVISPLKTPLAVSAGLIAEEETRRRKDPKEGTQELDFRASSGPG